MRERSLATTEVCFQDIVSFALLRCVSDRMLTLRLSVVLVSQRVWLKTSSRCIWNTISLSTTSALLPTSAKRKMPRRDWKHWRASGTRLSRRLCSKVPAQSWPSSLNSNIFFIYSNTDFQLADFFCTLICKAPWQYLFHCFTVFITRANAFSMPSMALLEKGVDQPNR